MEKKTPDVAVRMRLLRGKLGKAAFARLLNVSPAYITMIEKGKRLPGPALTELICLRFRVNHEWLLYGNEPMYSREEKVLYSAPEPAQAGSRIAEPAIEWEVLEKGTVQSKEHPEQMTLVNVYTLEVLQKPQKTSIRVPLETLIISSRTARTGPIAFRMRGDSFGSTIKDGAIFGINYRDLRVTEGKIYLIKLSNGDVVVRRIFIEPNKFLLRSDNPLFPDLTIDSKECRVMARVAWALNEM